MYFAVFKGAAANISAFNVNASATPTTTASVGSVVVPKTLLTGTNTTINLTNLTETLAIGGSSTYTVVVWILETGTDQTWRKRMEQTESVYRMD